MSYGQQKPWSGMYMQHSTYSHDFSQLGISPRQRPGDNVYNASVRADIPAGTYRPTMYDQMESPRREDAQQRYDYRGDLTERRIPKRGTEWIGGRRYDNEPREGRHDMYERQRRIDMSPERYDRGRNGSPERIDRGRNGSPERERKFDQVREPNERHNRYIDKDKNRHIYPAWYDYPRETARDKYDERYEKPRDQIMDGYANHKMSDRTTQKDYGEFMLEKIKQDELRRNLDYPRQEAPAAQSGGVYLFIRTDKGALTEIRKALQEGRSVLANSGGQLKGIAHSEQIALVQGNQGWNIQYNSAYIMIVFEFSKSKDAEEWLQSNHKLKNLYSPAVLDAFTAPINYRPTFDAIGNTFLMIEYPRVIQEKIRNEFIPKVQALLRKFYDFDDKLPVMAFGYDGGLEIKHLGGYWVRPKSTLICLRFKSRNEAIDFWQNSEFREAQEDIRREIERRPWFSTDQLFHPTAVIFSFTETKV